MLVATLLFVALQLVFASGFFVTFDDGSWAIYEFSDKLQGQQGDEPIEGATGWVKRVRCTKASNMSQVGKKFAIKIAKPTYQATFFLEVAGYMLADANTMHKPEGIPAVQGKGSSEDIPFGQPGTVYQVMIMEVLGQDLTTYYYENVGTIDKSSWICFVASRILHTLSYLNLKEITHGDIKGENLMFNEMVDGIIYLVDFGHAYWPQLKQFYYRRGDIMYMSHNTHLGNLPNPRDDLETLLNVLCVFAGYDLPWKGLVAIYESLANGPEKDGIFNEIGDSKLGFYSTFCNGSILGLPEELLSLLRKMFQMARKNIDYDAAGLSAEFRALENTYSGQNEVAVG